MKCPVCGATCVCRNATELCCGCHHHKARSPLVRLGREVAHGAVTQKKQGGQLELFPEMRLKGGEGSVSKL